jgi:PAS domain S-box-containing protein
MCMLSIENIQAVYRNLPVPSLIVYPDLPDFTIAYGNDAFLKATSSTLEDIIGNSFFTVFIKNPGSDCEIGKETTSSVLTQALVNKEPQKILLQRYDFRKENSIEVERHYWNTEIYPILDDQNEVKFIVITPLDVTDKVISKETENIPETNLLMDKDLSHSLFDNYPDAVFTLDLNGIFNNFNKVLLEIAECPAEVLLQSSFIPFIASEDSDYVKERFQKAINGEVLNFDAHVISAKGNHRILNITHVPITVKNEIIGLYLIAKDITAIKNTEAQVEQYNQRISTILESITDGFIAVDEKWIVTYWNKEAEHILGKLRTEIMGKNLWEAYVDAMPLKFYSEYHKAMSERVPVYFTEYYPALGIWLEVTVNPTDKGLSVFFKDITQRIKTEDELRETKKKYKELFNLNPLPNWVFEVDTLKFLDVNQAAIDHYGYSREEFLSMSIKDLRPAEDFKLFDELVKTKIIPGLFHRSAAKHLKKSGELIYVELKGNPILFGDIKAHIVVSVDVTEVIKAEHALKESMERYSIVSKATSDAVYDWDLLDETVRWNESFSKIFGHEENFVNIYNKWYELVHPDDTARVTKNLNLHIKNKEPRVNNEYRFLCANGEYKYVLDRSYLVFNESGEPIRMIGAMQDISERLTYMREIEAQNEKLNEITWMQCHIVRAPLTKILGLAELLANLEEDPKKTELLSHLMHSAFQLDDIIKDIIKKTETIGNANF